MTISVQYMYSVHCISSPSPPCLSMHMVQYINFLTDYKLQCEHSILELVSYSVSLYTKWAGYT